MAKSSLVSALNERNAKLSAISNATNQVVDEAFESLFGAMPTASHPTRNTAQIPIDQLHPFFTANIGFKSYNDENLKTLAEDILENGLIENIKIRPCKTGGYEILSGHNRVKACKRLGWSSITADIEYVDDARAVVIATVTNLQRRQHLLPVNADGPIEPCSMPTASKASETIWSEPLPVNFTRRRVPANE